MVVDQLGIRHVEVEPPSAITRERLRQAGIDVAPGRVLDLTLAGTKYEVMKPVLDILLEAPEFDLVLAVVGSSARFQPQLAVRPIVESIGQDKPLAAMLVPDAPQALAELTRAGVPCFRSPEACADAIAAVFSRRGPTLSMRLGSDAAASLDSAEPSALSEAQAYKLLLELGVPHAPVVTMPLRGHPPELPFDFPVAVKVCSPHIPHKTEVGGVVLGVNTPAELDEAVNTLRTNLQVRAAGLPCEELLIQPMSKGLAEVLIGYRVDPQAGPLIMLAAGGIWAELMKDRSIRLAPVSEQTALEMINEVQALRVLTGLRGRPRGDVRALAQAIAGLSALAVRAELGVREAEVNPLMVMAEGQGVRAVDALVILS